MGRIAGRRCPAAAVLLLAACGGSGPAPERQVTQDTALVGSVEVATAQRLVRDYFDALLADRPDQARELLAPGPRSDMSREQMEREVDALESLRIRKLRTVEAAPERIVLEAFLQVEPNPARPGEWVEGENTRWIEVVHGWRGWRIRQIARVPIPAEAWWPVPVWAQVHILDAELSLEVPNAWARRSSDWVWHPRGGGAEVGVRWADGEAAADSAALLPAGARVMRTAPASVGWGQGRLYVVEVPAGDDGESVLEQWVVLRSREGRVYGFFARSADPEEMRPLLSVLRRMYTSAQPTAATDDALPAREPGRRP
jgi:hypothetical protein